MNIMRWVLLSVLACVLGACASVVSVRKIGVDSDKQQESYKVVGEAPGEGVYYTLPRTVVKISMPMTLVSPGYKAKEGGDAEKKVAGSKNEKQQSEKPAKAILKPNFSDVSITTTSIPDPSQIFYIKVDRNSSSDMSFMIKRSVYGQLQSIGASSVNRTSDIIAEFARYGTYLGAGWLSGGFSTTLPTVSGSSPDMKVYSAVAGDIAVDQLYQGGFVDRDISNNEVANCSGGEFDSLKRELFSAKKDLLFGNKASDSTAEALQIRLNGINALEKELIEGCGKKATNVVLSYSIMPGDINEPSGGNDYIGVDGKYVVPVMYIDEKSGSICYLREPYAGVEAGEVNVCADISGRSVDKKSIVREKYQNWLKSKYRSVSSGYVFLEVSPSASLGMAFKDTNLSGLEGDHGFFYREPGIGRVELTYKNSTIASALVPIAQYGTVFAMPKTLHGKQMQHDVIFYYDTGAISSYAVNSASHKAEDLKPYYESMAEILNANLKLQQQQKAADAAAAKSASTTAATPATP
jgi:hypothetical protein